MDYHLYKKSGGNPRVVTAEITNTSGGAYTESAVVSGIAGKKIIPMWIMLNSVDSSGVFAFRLSSGSTNIMNNITMLNLAFPSFMIIDDASIGKISSGEDLNLAYKSHLGDDGTVGTATIGYYVING